MVGAETDTAVVPPHEPDHPRDLKPLIALEAATLIAGTGNGVAAIALPWLTLQLTGDPAAAGIVVAAAALPTLVASLASGVIIDRLGRQRTSVGSDLFSAVSAAMIPVGALLGVLTYPLVLVASVVGAVFDPVGVTSREAMLPDVAKRARLQLERVNGVHEAVWGLAWLVGPGVAGLLIATFGAEMSFWAMCAGFALSALLVATACMPTPPPRTGPAKPWLAEALDGLRHVVGTPAIRSTTVLATISFTLAFSVVGVVLPVVYERMDSPRELGFLLMVFSAGSIVGSLGYGALGDRIPRRPVFIAGLVGIAVLAAVYAFSPSYAMQLALMAVVGVLIGPTSPIANVVLQERTDDELRGRALSMVFALDYALYPVGYLAAGFLIKGVGVEATFGVMAVGAALIVVWSLATPGLRELQRPGGVVSESAAGARGSQGAAEHGE